MHLRFLIQEAFQALRANKLRSALTVIGIVVGIFAVTAMLALGQGLEENVASRISSFSQGDVSISGTLTHEDLAWVHEQVFVQASMGTLALTSQDVIVFGEEFNVSVQSVLGDFQAIQQFEVKEGTTFDFTDVTYRTREAVGTVDLDTAVREKTGRGIVGSDVVVGNQQYRVVGTIDVPTPGFRRTDGTLYVPYRSAVGTLAESGAFSTVGVKLADSSEFEITGEYLLQGLNVAHNLPKDSDDLFTVSSAQSIIESAQETTGMISLFLGIVGGIALFVGGIGTMNMMLTTVTERTKEIGLRKAIGARRRDILLQILIESVVLTLIGGALGVALTALGAFAANRVFENSTVISVIVSPQVVMLAAAVAFGVGVVFGLYPAHRASKLQPVDALRAE